jgi:hypothetical protein
LQIKKTKNKKMKKIFTLMTGLLLTLAVMAADRGPDLTVRMSRNYKVVIDGRTLYSNGSTLRVNHLPRGYHTIQVFEVRNTGFFGQKQRMVNSSSFRMGKEDIKIFIDMQGRINILKDKEYRRFDRTDDRTWDNRDWNDRSRDNDNRPIDPRDNDDRRIDDRNGDRRNDDRNGDRRRN